MTKFFQTVTREDWPFVHAVMGVALFIVFLVGIVNLATL